MFRAPGPRRPAFRFPLLRTASATLLAGAVISAATSASAADPADGDGSRERAGTKAASPAPRSKQPDVVFIPTPPAIVDRMLDLAAVTREDVVYDLGCGDGRIVIRAACRFGCRGVGYEIDADLLKRCAADAQREKVADRVRFADQDLLEADLSPATVVTLYLSTTLNRKLVPRLERLPAGTRIVSHLFDLPGVRPERTVEIESEEGHHVLYVYRTPLKRVPETPTK